MLMHTLHHAAWLYRHGHYDQAARIFSHLLHVERHHPRVVEMIHRFMYALNPDWGL